jgi:hypothetical protein
LFVAVRITSRQFQIPRSGHQIMGPNWTPNVVTLHHHRRRHTLHDEAAFKSTYVATGFIHNIQHRLSKCPYHLRVVDIDSYLIYVQLQSACTSRSPGIWPGSSSGGRRIRPSSLPFVRCVARAVNTSVIGCNTVNMIAMAYRPCL